MPLVIGAPAASWLAIQCIATDGMKRPPAADADAVLRQRVCPPSGAVVTLVASEGAVIGRPVAPGDGALPVATHPIARPWWVASEHDCGLTADKSALTLRTGFGIAFGVNVGHVQAIRLLISKTLVTHTREGCSPGRPGCAAPRCVRGLFLPSTGYRVPLAPSPARGPDPAKRRRQRSLSQCWANRGLPHPAAASWRAPQPGSPGRYRSIWPDADPS